MASCSSNTSFNSDIGFQNQGYSELLEAFVAAQDIGIPQNTCSNGNFKVSEMRSLRMNFDGVANETVEFEQESRGNEKENHVDDKYCEEEEDKVDGDNKRE